MLVKSRRSSNVTPLQTAWRSLSCSRSRRRVFAIASAAVGLALAAACIRPSQGHEISRARAVEIARPHVPFQADRVKAERARSDARLVWRVTFRGRLPGQPPGLFETVIVEVDRRSGEVVSIERS